MSVSLYRNDIEDIKKKLGQLSKSMEDIAKSLKTISSFLAPTTKQENIAKQLDEENEEDIPGCFMDPTIYSIKEPVCYGDDYSCCNLCARKVKE